MPISDRPVRARAWLWLAGLALGGCAPELGAPGSAPEVRSMKFPGGIVVSGPEGYCIDPRASQRQQGFALLASCRALTGDEEARWVAPAILTVTAIRAEAAEPSAAMLAQAVTPARLSHARVDGGVALGRVDGGGDEVLPGGDPRHWRGVMRQGNRLLGLAVYAPRDSAAADGDGARLIRGLARAIRQGSAAPPAQVENRAASGPRAAQKRPAGGLGVLERLFGRRVSE